jgi:hypothetical protein
MAAELEEDPASPSDAAPPKPRRLTIQLIGEQSLEGDASELRSLSADEYAERVLGLQRLRLGHLRLGSMDGLEPCNAATHLYLQHNLLSEIESLDIFARLQFLVLSHNRLTQVTGVSHLATLLHLDLSHNQIEEVTRPSKAFPPALVQLSVAANPCASLRGHRVRLLTELPSLRRLDDLDVRPWERGQEEEADNREEEADHGTRGNAAGEADVYPDAAARSADVRASAGMARDVAAAAGEEGPIGEEGAIDGAVTSAADAALNLYERFSVRSRGVDMPDTVRSKLEMIRERSRRRRAEAMQDTSIPDAIAQIGRERARLRHPAPPAGGGV